MSILKSYLIYICIAVAGIALTLTLYFSFAPKELANWDHGAHADKACPIYGYYPVPYKSSLHRDIDTDGLVLGLNKYLLKKTGHGSWFVLGDYDGFSIRIIPAKNKDFCQQNYVGKNILARSFDIGHPTARIEVCVGKILALMKVPQSRGKPRLTWKRVIWHEMIANVIGPNHPKWGCGLMCAAGTETWLHERTVKLLQQVVAKCRKRGRLGMLK